MRYLPVPSFPDISPEPSDIPAVEREPLNVGKASWENGRKRTGSDYFSSHQGDPGYRPESPPDHSTERQLDTGRHQLRDGRRIVEHEQEGKPKAGYGKQTIQELSRQLTEEFGRGFSKRNLEYMRRFYLEYCGSAPPAVPDGSDTAVSAGQPIVQTLSAQFTPRFAPSWSHYILLMNIGNQEERQFYEIEAQQNRWSLSERKRQFNTGLYERLALSRDKSGVRALARTGHVIEKPQDMLKDPYVLEFLGLDEKASYRESDLESAIIDKLEPFLNWAKVSSSKRDRSGLPSMPTTTM